MEIDNKIQNRSATICVIGLGYVGLPTAILFAEKGYNVNGADVDEEKVNKVNDGESIYEELEVTERLKDVINKGKMKVTTDIVNAVSGSDVTIITVPTPVTISKKPDLSYVMAASEDVAKGLRNGQLIVLESTTYPGTTEDIVRPILEKTGLKAGTDYGLAYCPERYNPGDKKHTIDKVSRIIGAIDTSWANTAKLLYETIITGDIKIVKNIKTAEAAKIVENIQRDLNIALVNEFALIFEKLGVDVIDVLDAASTKWNFIKFTPGPGVGGHCLPVDPYYLTHKAQELGYYPKLILAGRSINDHMSQHVVDLIIDGLNSIGKPVSDSKFAIIGLAYKSNTGDIRESPSIKIINLLLGMNGSVSIYDPLVSNEDCIRSLEIDKSTFDDVLKDADCVVNLSNHDIIKEKLSLSALKEKVKENCVVVDTQYHFSPKDVIDYGFIYKGIGRGSA